MSGEHFHGWLGRMGGAPRSLPSRYLLASLPGSAPALPLSRSRSPAHPPTPLLYLVCSGARRPGHKRRGAVVRCSGCDVRGGRHRWASVDRGGGALVHSEPPGCPGWFCHRAREGSGVEARRRVQGWPAVLGRRQGDCGDFGRGEGGQGDRVQDEAEEALQEDERAQAAVDQVFGDQDLELVCCGFFPHSFIFNSQWPGHHATCTMLHAPCNSKSLCYMTHPFLGSAMASPSGGWRGARGPAAGPPGGGRKALQPGDNPPQQHEQHDAQRVCGE